MALFKFTRAILAGEPIEVFNHGQMRRDFTYVDDVVQGVIRVLDRPPRAAPCDAESLRDPGRSTAAFRVYNIGNQDPVDLMEAIAILERNLGRKAGKVFLPMQPGDVPATFADVDDLAADTGFRPKTPLAEGIARFVSWYLDYHRIPK
jgi:UDP-glucuronate 4-epimerase